jgi:F-type H+-transporting ATPase subunit b
MRTTNLAEGNFLVPNGTFFVEILAFLLLLWALWKWVLPPINKAMAERQQGIRQSYEELEEAKAKAEAAENEYRSQLAEARHEAARIREQAREEGATIIAEMREQAQQESQRILQHAHLQIDAERRQVVQQLRTQVGSMATTLAGRIVGESLEDDERRTRTVERFISSLEEADSVDRSGAR